MGILPEITIARRRLSVGLPGTTAAPFLPPRRTSSRVSSERPPCLTAALWQAGEGDLPAGRTRVLSTGGMLEAARTTKAPAVLVATETGMLHQLRRANPAVRWEAANPAAVCRYMKMTTPAALLRCLREGVTEVTVDPDVAARARRAVEAMVTTGAR